MAPLKGYGEVMESMYQWFLPTVEHCMEQIANDWCSRIKDRKTYDRMVDRLCHQVGTHRLLSTFTSSDHLIIKGWAAQIEKEVLSGIVMHNEEGISSHEENF